MRIELCELGPWKRSILSFFAPFVNAVLSVGLHENGRYCCGVRRVFFMLDDQRHYVAGFKDFGKDLF